MRRQVRGRRASAAALRMARIMERKQVDLLNAHNWTAAAVGFIAA